MIESVQLFGLLLLTAAASFRFLLLRGREDTRPGTARQSAATRDFQVMAVGLIIGIASGLALRPTLWFSVTQLLLVIVLFAAHFLATRSNRSTFPALAAFAGLGIAGMQAFSSHAASEPGLLPIVTSALHWLVAIGWGGTVLHIALQPWSATVSVIDGYGYRVGEIVNRYAVWSLIALTLLALTGGMLGFIHIHNADAMNSTAYGSGYKLKALLLVALIITASVNTSRIAPALRQAASADVLQRALNSFRKIVYLEALLFAAMFLASGYLASANAPGVAPFLSPQTWHVQAGEMPLKIILQPVAGQVSKARLEIAADGDLRFPDGTIATLSLRSAASEAANTEVEALPIGPAAFLGEVVLSVPGSWQFDVTLNLPDGESRSTSHTVSIPGPPLQKDLRAYLNLSTITYSRANVLTFSIGTLLILTAVWTVQLCARQKAPAWMMTAGLLNAALGGFLILTVMFVKTYPSSFWPNPQPFTFDVVQEGDDLYRTHCADCHGITGAGDGPNIPMTRESIPDLAAPHMDTHADGEIFWWIKYGIPSLEMPALGDELTDDENWKVINFVRSLRHDIPQQ